jgi:glycosyltransferase involved in cell wall biosynthesis
MAIGVDLVLATRPNATTGIERYALNLFSALREMAPDAIGYIDQSSDVIDGPGLIRVKGGFSGWLTLPGQSAFRTGRSDILLCPAFPPSPLVLAKGIPVARIIHDDFPWTRTKALNLRGRMLFKHFEALFAPRYRHVFAPTEMMARNLTAILKRPVAPIGNAPGLDLTKAPAVTARRPQFIAVGTIEPRKNYEAPLAALDRLPPEWTAAVVGRKGWGPVAEAWDEQLRRTGSRLTWHGHASNEDLLALYQQSSCFVSMSFAEGFNMPLVEAGSLGLPVVASDIEIHRSVAPPWARFVPLDATPDTLAQTITQAAAIPIAPGDAEAYRRKFSWGHIATEVRSRLQP